MAEQILDGNGSGFRAQVGSDKRLQVRAVSEDELIHNGELGNAYNFNTGLITVSGDATLIYFKNNSTDNFILTDIALAAFDGITHSNSPYITVIRNPTAGDLITDATAISMNQNRNFGSSKTAEANIYKGKTGGTITGGSDIGIFLSNKTGRSFFTINMLLPKGSSVAIKLTANLSSGSASYYCALLGYYKDSIDAE